MATTEETNNKRQKETLVWTEKVFRPLPDVVVAANVDPIEYEDAIKRGQHDFVAFWEDAAHDLHWFSKWDKVLDDSNPPFFRWFVGARCNIVYNALDRHIETHRKNKVAIIWEGERGDSRKLTYYELYREVNRFANVLLELGVRKGDRVIIYMPNIPEIAIAMLACAKTGAVHSVVYAGYSAMALRDRINHAEARLVITADGSYRNGKTIDLKKVIDDAMIECPTVDSVVVVKRTGQEIDMTDGRYLWYHDLMEAVRPEAETEDMDAEDMLYILYTSGTTGKPKGVVHVHGGYMVGVYRTVKWVFDIKDTDIYWCAADPGWITGHSYIIYGPLMCGATTVMYEGHALYPKPDRMWEIVEKYGVNIFYTSPTIIRMLMRFGSRFPRRHDLSTLRLLGTVGEPISPQSWIWLYEHIGRENCPVMDTWWQTETGMFIITPLPISLLKPGSVSRAFPGVNAEVLDIEGNPVLPRQGGFLAIKNPWPAMFRTLYKEPEAYRKSYWEKIPGYYLTGDVAYKDEDGYFWIQGRADDVLNIGGYRIGTTEVEAALVAHKAVVEAAVIGIPDRIKGEVAKAFVILNEDFVASDGLINELKDHVRHVLGPIVIMKSVDFVDSLPKTTNGKIMRRLLKAKELGVKEADITTLGD
jgi:acetyl-CoA synthetase